MTRVTLILSNDERKALISLANLERREPRQQAAILVRESLIRRGLLPDTHTAVIAGEPNHESND